MKKIFKKIGYTAILLALVFISTSFVVNATSAPTAPTEDQASLDMIKPLIHLGAGHQFVAGVMNISESIAPAFGAAPMFGATSSTGRSSVFDAPDAHRGPSKTIGSVKNGGTLGANDYTISSFFTALGNSWFGGRMFVGVGRGTGGFAASLDQELSIDNPWVSNLDPFGSTFNATLQTINVKGNILATNLIHTDANNESVCIEPNGSLVVCTNYSCTDTAVAPDDSVMCSGDNVGLTTNVSSTFVSDCTTATKCEFVCQDGFHMDGATCVADAFACEGEWTEAESCLGNYSTGICRSESGGCISGDISCSSGAWSSLPANCQNLTIQNCPETTPASCNANPLCSWLNPVIQVDCSVRTTSLECNPIVDVLGGCTWVTSGSQSCVGPTNSFDCLSQGGGIYPSCSWEGDTTQCSDSNPVTEGACTSQNGGGTCNWVAQ